MLNLCCPVSASVCWLLWHRMRIMKALLWHAVAVAAGHFSLIWSGGCTVITAYTRAVGEIIETRLGGCLWSLVWAVLC